MKLGDKARCRISGLTGIVVSRAEHLNGCVRWLIQPPVDKDGKMPDQYWIDNVSLETIEPTVIEHKEVSTGGPTERVSPQ